MSMEELIQAIAVCVIVISVWIYADALCEQDEKIKEKHLENDKTELLETVNQNEE